MKVGIVGYGNLGKGVESAISYTKDMELVGIFTRRNPKSIKSNIHTTVYSIDTLYEMKDAIDVLILCGGSVKDLPKQTKQYAKDFNVVDSYDIHDQILEHFNAVHQASIEGKHISIISVGWDPGLFSLNRLYGQAVLPNGKDYTFWGKGVSQGHSDAIRKIDGVVDAREYTIPMQEVIDKIKSGEDLSISNKDMHRRECFVVVKEGSDVKKIETEIKKMPHYFEGYQTSVHFISQEEMNMKHKNLSHGGCVFRKGVTGSKHLFHQVMEYRLTLESNPEFTASILVAYARAAYRLANEGQIGCKTIFDVAPIYLHEENRKELIKKLL